MELGESEFPQFNKNSWQKHFNFVIIRKVIDLLLHITS